MRLVKGKNKLFEFEIWRASKNIESYQTYNLITALKLENITLCVRTRIPQLLSL